MNDRIVKVWFGDGRIYVLTETGVELSQPLEVFPALLYASSAEREQYYLWDDDRSIRWNIIDEDIHISHFYEREMVNYNNEVNMLLSRFPCLDIKAFAGYIGMHWTKLARFRYGVWTPSPDVLQRIRDGLSSIRKQITEVELPQLS